MGWGSGSELLVKITKLIDPYIPLHENFKADLYLELIDMFEDGDCDTIDECEGRGPAALDLAVWRWRSRFEED